MRRQRDTDQPREAYEPKAQAMAVRIWAEVLRRDWQGLWEGCVGRALGEEELMGSVYGQVLLDYTHQALSESRLSMYQPVAGPHERTLQAAVAAAEGIREVKQRQVLEMLLRIRNSLQGGEHWE